MRDLVRLKMKEFAKEWLKDRDEHYGVKNQHEQSALDSFEDNLMNVIPDFHEFFFSRFEKEFSPYNQYTRQFLFLMLYMCLDEWCSQGLSTWERFRLELTEGGEARFGGN